MGKKDKSIKEYFSEIYGAKYFLMHLVRWDIKYKFRRSKIGVLWTIIQPLMLTVIIAAIFGFVFKQPMAEYAPYILSGLLVWDVIIGAVISNSSSFLSAESYIRQFAHPVALYPLRATLVSIITFIIASVSLVTWELIMNPENIVVALISFPLTVFLLFCLAWPISLMTSHIHVRYRDYPYVMNLVMQIIWYMSPVFFQESMFMSNALLHRLFVINPITQILTLIREPFLNGRFASLYSYGYICTLAVVLMVVSWRMNKKYEKNTIFYI